MAEDETLALVRKRSRELDRTLWWRDAREVLAGLIAGALIAPMLGHGGWLTRAGVLLVLAGLVLVFTMLIRARHTISPRAEWPLAEVLRAETAKLDAQIRLLETVLWWYVAPLTLGAVLIVVGMTGISWFSAIYLVFAALLAWGIYEANQRAVRRVLRPRRNELQQLLDRLDESNGTGNPEDGKW